ncbi:SDR family NAD(P)-dependent oxidoreductase [Leptospira ilyithenensis]|uniref:SDR family oxidoreductase n=1 Tax=Leptospira ilyithenensis TaxID=2484901 RepID=A0A4R9LS67_9LEPT|nr:SDR family oxidoreductase [Leptospira ilyithenensis]TGN14134.1 SDR family oxidoreductase [Leptospira ilyithenensis]
MKNAYVTGASQGIGKEFVRALAQDYNVFLISRSAADLNKAIVEIEPRSRGMLKAISLDLTKKKEQEELASILEKDKDFELLVNNAGFGTVGEFAGLDLEQELDEINLNVKALVLLSHKALNKFKKTGKGFLINVASVAGYLPAPGSATYAATKAFVKSFTESLHEEAKPYGIYVQALCPGLTHSDFHQRAGIEKSKYPSLLWQNANEVVEESLSALRYNKAVCITGVVNQGAISLTELMPRALLRKTAGLFLKFDRK